ncbi:DUF421 domain-containing protein [Maribacter sp. 2-571]|uniref:DUF421 domain-containing protein n=1 Tax=Maribacter sp. 2-571 TaxID=3417569 RepID=UPI003D33BDA8
MEKWVLSSAASLFWLLISVIAVYLAVIGLTRLFGKRSFSKMSSFDFAVTIAIGSIIASTLLSSSVSISKGVLGLTSVYVLQWLISYLRRFKAFQNIVDNEPLLLMEGTKVLWDNLKSANVTEDDLKAKLREANVIELSEVRAVVFETTGDIAVLHTCDSEKSVEPWLLEGVHNS